MLATVATANIKKVQIKKYSIFIYSEAETHAMYAIYKQMRTLCVLQYTVLVIIQYIIIIYHIIIPIYQHIISHLIPDI